MLYSKLNDITFSVIDVETTGLSHLYENVIEIGIVKIHNNEVIDSFSTLINPLRSIPPFITKLTGIKNSDLDNKPTFDEITQDLIAFIDNTVLVGHNISFDFNFIFTELKRNGVDNFNPIRICTLKLAKKLYPELKSRSLGNLAFALNIPHTEAHRALGDAKTTAYILIQQLKELKILGISELHELLSFQIIGAKKPEIVVGNTEIINFISTLPRLPGIYYFMNKKNEIIYVGKAKSLKDRLKSYFSKNISSKTKKIIKQAKSLKVEITNSELTALLYESELIKIVDPKFNIQLKRYTSKHYLRIRRDIPFPKIELTSDFDFDGNDYYGIFLNRRQASQLIEIIDKAFLIRECSDREFKKNRLCYLAEIERCIAPCVQSDVDKYNYELSKIEDFIFGKTQYILDRLLERMKRYSDELKYEKCMEIKEIIQLVLKQIQKSSLISEPINRAKLIVRINSEVSNPDLIMILEGKVFVNEIGKKNERDESILFDQDIDDYFENAINNKFQPSLEDLEKLKTLLNWIIRNRHLVSIYYLSNFSTKQQLLNELSNFNKKPLITPLKHFEIKLN